MVLELETEKLEAKNLYKKKDPIPIRPNLSRSVKNSEALRIIHYKLTYFTRFFLGIWALIVHIVNK